MIHAFFYRVSWKEKKKIHVNFLANTEFIYQKNAFCLTFAICIHCRFYLCMDKVSVGGVSRQLRIKYLQPNIDLEAWSESLRTFWTCEVEFLKGSPSVLYRGLSMTSIHQIKHEYLIARSVGENLSKRREICLPFKTICCRCAMSFISLCSSLCKSQKKKEKENSSVLHVIIVYFTFFFLLSSNFNYSCTFIRIKRSLI